MENISLFSCHVEDNTWMCVHPCIAGSSCGSVEKLCVLIKRLWVRFPPSAFQFLAQILSFSLLDMSFEIAVMRLVSVIGIMLNTTVRCCYQKGLLFSIGQIIDLFFYISVFFNWLIKLVSNHFC